MIKPHMFGLTVEIRHFCISAIESLAVIRLFHIRRARNDGLKHTWPVDYLTDIEELSAIEGS